MKIFDNIIGQPHVTTILQDAVNAAQNSIESQEMTHSWLFTGPPGSGRSIAAASFAAALVCPNNGCGICVDCETAMAGSHVDIEIVKTEGLSIKVDDIRELISRAAWAPSLSNWRIVILEDAERLTEAAANALLKAIEEPSSRNIWLLCSSSITEILPTIRSRCRILQLQTPSHESIVKLLVERDKIQPDLAEYAARISQGHIGRAKYLSKSPDSCVRRNQMLKMVLNLKNSTHAIDCASEFLKIVNLDSELRIDSTSQERLEEEMRFQHSQKNTTSLNSKSNREMKKKQKSLQVRMLKDSLERSLQDLMSIYRDILFIKSGIYDLVSNQDMLAELIEVNERITSSKCVQNIVSIMTSKNQVLSNVTPVLLIENLFCEIVTP